MDGESEVEDKLEQAQDQSEDAAAESFDPSPSLVRGQCAAGKSSLPSILIHRTGGIPSFYFKFLLKFIVKQSRETRYQDIPGCAVVYLYKAYTRNAAKASSCSAVTMVLHQRPSNLC